VTRRTQAEDAGVDAMTSLLCTPKYLLQQLQRDRRLPRRPTADSRDPILDVSCPNLMNAPVPQLADGL
jgi:hypothetical protein